MDLVINVSADPGAVTGINSDGQTATNRLIYALVVATSIPAIFFLLFGWAVSTHKAASDGYALLVFLAIAHVPLTAFFWVDRRYREHMASDVGTYYGVPALIIGTATAVPLIFGAVGLTYLFIGYFVWLLWHYGRQNLGVLSLVSIGTKTPAPSKIERHLYDAACIAGLMGALATLPQAKESVLAPVLNISYWVGLGMMVAIVAACTLVFFGNYRRGDTNQRLIMTALVSVFFVPSFLPTNFNVAAYAHAHALQYFVIMYTLAGDRQQGNLVIRLGALSLLAVVGYYISIWLNDKTLLGDWVTVGSAAGIGITMTHFFLDSRLWRLREPFQRAAVKESFSFLFK